MNTNNNDNQIKLEITLDKENDPETVADMLLFLEQLSGKKPTKKTTQSTTVRRRYKQLQNNFQIDTPNRRIDDEQINEVPLHALDPLLSLYEVYHKVIYSNLNIRNIDFTMDSKTLNALEDVIKYLRTETKKEFHK